MAWSQFAQMIHILARDTLSRVIIIFVANCIRAGGKKHPYINELSMDAAYMMIGNVVNVERQG